MRRIDVRRIYRAGPGLQICLTATSLIVFVCGGAFAEEPSVAPAGMARIGKVDERFQSYNVEMVEVTGGRFWKPYGPNTSDAPSDLFQYRPSIDLANARLRRLAAALAPAYMRVSGTWATATYFSDSDSSPSQPPPGFNGVLSREQWRGVIDFSHAVGAQLVTSFAVSPGTRDAAGVWTADQARSLLAFTSSVGGRIAAAEFMNEPNVVAGGVAPVADDAAGYGRDFKTFRSLLQSTPEMKILGPGMAGGTGPAPRPPPPSRARPR